jgi:iron complex transport system substrate-binding protein
VAVDASAYFSRPGPRLVTGIELLAHILHPETAGEPWANGAAGPLLVDLQVRAEGLEPPRAKPTSS